MITHIILISAEYRIKVWHVAWNKWNQLSGGSHQEFTNWSKAIDGDGKVNWVVVPIYHLTDLFLSFVATYKISFFYAGMSYSKTYDVWL